MFLLQWGFYTFQAKQRANSWVGGDLGVKIPMRKRALTIFTVLKDNNGKNQSVTNQHSRELLGWFFSPSSLQVYSCENPDLSLSLSYCPFKLGRKPSTPLYNLAVPCNKVPSTYALFSHHTRKQKKNTIKIRFGFNEHEISAME